jgi:hypothetical protein
MRTSLSGLLQLTKRSEIKIMKFVQVFIQRAATAQHRTAAAAGQSDQPTTRANACAAENSNSANERQRQPPTPTHHNQLAHRQKTSDSTAAMHHHLGSGRNGSWDRSQTALPWLQWPVTRLKQWPVTRGRPPAARFFVAKILSSVRLRGAQCIIYSSRSGWCNVVIVDDLQLEEAPQNAATQQITRDN